jgi:hypothetical protein
MLKSGRDGLMALAGAGMPRMWCWRSPSTNVSIHGSLASAVREIRAAVLHWFWTILATAGQLRCGRSSSPVVKIDKYFTKPSVNTPKLKTIQLCSKLRRSLTPR